MISDNTSEDSIGSDSSFDSIKNEREEGTLRIKKDNNSILEDLKFKHDRYIQYKKSIYQKNDEFKKENSQSMWRILYYTFFNNFNQKSTITLNELELRCKFLFNMDKINKLDDEIKKKKIETLTNIEPFIQYYNLKRDDNLLINIFSKTTNEEDEEKQKEKLNNTNYKTKILSRNNKNENIKEKRHLSMDKIYKKKKKIYHNSLFEVYGFKENEELFEAITRINEKYKNEKNKIYIDNLAKINEGKFAFSREIQLIDQTFESNKKIKNEIKDIINVNHNSKFFEDNQNKDLIKEYNSKLQPQNRMSRQINTLNNKILSKLAPQHKIII